MDHSSHPWLRIGRYREAWIYHRPSSWSLFMAKVFILSCQPRSCGSSKNDRWRRRCSTVLGGGDVELPPLPTDGYASMM